MALIEKIEINALKEAFKSPFLYVGFIVFAGIAYSVNTIINFPILLAIAFVFSLILVIDFKHYIIPDTTQVALFILANLLVYTSVDRFWVESYVGFALALFVFGGIYVVFEYLLKKPAIGLGDVKLLANVGLLLGALSFNVFLWILTITAGSFVIIKKLRKSENKMIPYGPFIVVSAWICLLYFFPLNEIYLDILKMI